MFRRVESLFPGYVYASHVLSFRRDRVMPEEEVRGFVEGLGFEIASMDYRTAREGAHLEYRMIIRTRDRRNLARLASFLVKLEGRGGLPPASVGGLNRRRLDGIAQALLEHEMLDEGAAYAAEGGLPRAAGRVAPQDAASAE